MDDLQGIHARLRSLCDNLLDGIYVCPHHPEEGFTPLKRTCPCRKPKSGLLAQALREWRLSHKRCLLLGDAPRDLVAARDLGIATALIRGSKVPSPDHWPQDQLPHPEFLPDLKAAVAWTDKVMADV
jgi:histidinol phosphatase-like enzyme